MKRGILATIALLFVLPPSAWAQDRWIYAVGGGNRPQEGFKRAARIARQTGGADVRAVVIGYASGQPEVYFESFSKQLRDEGISQIDGLLQGPTDPAGIDAAIAKIESAQLICFTGGDQNDAMKYFREPAIRKALHARYRAGVPFITTSAGTALLSERMLTGLKDDPVADGLGFVDNFVMEQHYVVKQKMREARVEKLVRETTVDHVVAIDEDAMLEIKNEEFAEVIGPQQVVIFSESPKSAVYRYSLWEGDKLNLKSWLPTLVSDGATCNQALKSDPLVRRGITVE